MTPPLWPLLPIKKTDTSQDKYLGVMMVSFRPLITHMRKNDGDIYRLPAFFGHITMARQIPPGHASKYFRIVFTPIFLLVNGHRKLVHFQLKPFKYHDSLRKDFPRKLYDKT